MPTHTGGCNFQMVDGSVHALQPTTLAALAQGLRRPGGTLAAIASGTEMAALQALQGGLRRQGVQFSDWTVRPAAEPIPVLMVIADQRDLHRPAGTATIFAIADQGPGTPLLLPAVQSARESARRIQKDCEVDLVLVQRPPGPGPRLSTESWSYNFTKIDIP